VRKASSRFGFDVAVDRDAVGLLDGYQGQGRSGTRDEELAMVVDAARSDGLLLEPVYTAKAVAALLELNRGGAFGSGPVLYWHTYGSPDPRPGSVAEQRMGARAG
jgi:D-cysteine desulfhydrase